ncbi:MAG: lysophospholipid acyltransferase family protein [Betaproteobacteria bacterium]
MKFLKSLIHLLWMLFTLIPCALFLLLRLALGASKASLYRCAVFWLNNCVVSLDRICGVKYALHGMDNLSGLEGVAVVVLVKHQSTYETFLMPVILPHPVSYVFKKELLRIPFFGWAIGCLDMIHIDRSQRAQAFAKVVEQGRVLLEKGNWVVMFPEGTRIDRGQVGGYKLGGARLAVQTGAHVVPVAVSSAKCWPRKALLKRAGTVDVSVGQPISSLGRSPEELMAQVQMWIESEMRRLDPSAYD